MNHLYHNHILNQFPPLRRKSLISWLRETSVGRKVYHKAFLSCLEEVNRTRRQEALDRRTKIAFSLMYEFGNRLSPNTIYFTLVDAVECRLSKASGA